MTPTQTKYINDPITNKLTRLKRNDDQSIGSERVNFSSLFPKRSFIFFEDAKSFFFSIFHKAESNCLFGDYRTLAVSEQVLSAYTSICTTLPRNGCSHSSSITVSLAFSLRFLSKSSKRAPLFLRFPWSSNTSVACTSSGIHS